MCSYFIHCFLIRYYLRLSVFVYPWFTNDAVNCMFTLGLQMMQLIAYLILECLYNLYNHWYCVLLFRASVTHVCILLIPDTFIMSLTVWT